MSPSHHPEFQFARCISSLTCAADRSGGGVPSHLRQTPFNNRKHTTTRRRAGAGHNRVMGLTRCDASLPVYGQGRAIPVAVGYVRFLLPLTLTRYLAGALKSSGPLGKSCGIEVGCSHLVASIHQRAADHSLNYRAKPLKAHFEDLRTNDPQAICGAVEGARNTRGEIQNV